MSIELPSFRIDAGDLLQHVSRVAYRNVSLYYGRDGTNHYDAPAGGYGVLYLGRDLPTALMESVFHKHRWDRDTGRSIALTEVQSRLVRVVGMLENPSLADLTAEGVMAGYDRRLSFSGYKPALRRCRLGYCARRSRRQLLSSPVPPTEIAVQHRRRHPRGRSREWRGLGAP